MCYSLLAFAFQTILISRFWSLDDLLPTVLGMYMHGDSQPLPTHEEVLICRADTTAEEVGLD